MIAHTTTALQYASVIVFLATIIAAVGGMRKRPRIRVFFLPPVVWAASGVVFYDLAFAGIMPQESYLLMSAAHRTMGAVLVLAIVLVLLGEVDDQ